MNLMNKIKQSRAVSFAVVAVVYIIAAAVGIMTYNRLSYSMWLNILIADVVATVVTFIFSVIFKNASVYDPYWSVQPIVIIGALGIGVELSPLRLAVLAAIMFWGVRLTANWAYTFRGLTHQDWRYTMLEEKTGGFYPIINFLGIHLVPTLIVYGCTMPAVVLFTTDVKANLLSFLFICISFGAVILQGSADVQMHRFRKDRTSTFIEFGLWKYSRHPNYLGEILMWWGVALAVVACMPECWWLCAGAFANNLLFLFVSIPMADKRQSAKPGFDEYKRHTRMLLPIKH